MFYLAVEEHVMHYRQRELAKELDFRRWLQGSSESRIVNWSQFLSHFAGQLRNLVCRSELPAGSLLDCVVH